MEINDRVKAINESRIRDIEAEKSLIDSIKPGETRSAEQIEQLERIQNAISDKDRQVRELVAIETREAEAAEIRANNSRIFGEREVERGEQNENDRIRAWLKSDPNTRPDLQVNVAAAARERQMLRAGYSHADIRNAIATDTGSIASAVPTTTARSLYEYMEASIAAFRLGATQITTTTGESMIFPNLSAHAIGTQVSGQGTAIGGTDPGFGKLTLGAKKYGQLVVVASEAIDDPVFNVAEFVGRDIGRGLGRLADADLVLGTNGITGGLMSSAIVGSNGTTSTGGTVANLYLAYPGLVNTVYAVNDEYRQRGAWLMRDATAGALRQIRDGGGGTIGAVMWEPSLTNGLVNGQPDRFLGYPVYTDPNVASLASNARIAAFGDFSSYYLRTVGNVEIESSRERYFDTDQVGFRGKWRLDGGYIDLTAVVLLKNSV